MPAAAVAVCMLAAAGLGARLLAAYWPFTVDDAFITFRYAQNLAAGHGATFNAGASPVEGYTSFSWMLLLALPHLLRVDAVIFAKIAGLLSTLGLLVATQRLGALALGGGPEASRSSAAMASMLLLALLPATWIHTISGMETALFACLLSLFFHATVGLAAGGSRPAAWRSGVLGLLVGLTRPEGNLAVVVALAVALVLAPRERRRRALGCIAVAYALPLAGYILWRLAYYRLPFPLASYIKMEGSSGLAGAGEVLRFGRHLGLWLAPLVLAGLPRLDRGLRPALAASAALVLFFLVPNPIMAYDWRYLFPVVPLLFALVAPGLAVLAAWLRLASPAPPRRRLAVSLAIQAIVVGALGVAFLHDVGASIQGKRRYAQAMTQAHIALSKVLAKIGPMQPPPLLALADAGAIPYYSGWRAIDTFGLNDATIARSGRHDPDYVLAQRPNLVILNSTSATDFRPRMPWLNDLYARSLEAGLVRLDVWFARQDEYYLWLLGDPEDPVVQRFQQLALQERASQGVVVLEVRCVDCDSAWRVQANIRRPRPLRPGMLPFPADDQLPCPRCGTHLDLSAARRDVEQHAGASIAGP